MVPHAFLPTFALWDMMVVAMVCLLVFGNRLPSVMRALARSATEFKNGSGPQPPWAP